jgi:membrane associated rhomboid family serine protease
MVESAEIVSVLIIIATVYFSYRGFTNRAFFERHIFHVERIVANREAGRIVSCGFLHANWAHLFFNMFALYSFSIGVIQVFGITGFILVYFGSLVAGNLLALYIHRAHGAYRAVGASGAVSGVVFASIVAFPHGTIIFLFLPVEIPSWIFGIGFVLVSIFGIGARVGNIGHEAHLGGAISGVILALMIRPAILTMYPAIVAAIVAPMAVFLYIVAKRPGLLRLRGTVEQKRDAVRGRVADRRRERLQEEMDRLLDKVNERGIQALSEGERKRLQEIADEKKRMKR